MNFSESEIVAACAQNDRKAQEQLYRQHFPTMLKMCLRYANGDRDRALMLLNDGFLRVFKKIHTFEGRGSLEGWIRRLVFHAISDFFKTNGRTLDLLIFDDALETHNANLSPSDGLMGEKSVFDQFGFDDLLSVVEKLPPATRDVFKLYVLDGFNHIEISEQLHISVGTSKWHLSNARERLRDLISKNPQLDITY